jgi:hypothetical protein
MRKALGAENTFKNCVKSIVFPYSREFSEKPFEAQAAEYRELLNAQRDAEYLKKEANGFIGLFGKLDSLESYSQKQKIMAFFEDMLINTYVMSYIGQFNFGYNDAHIESLHLYNSGVTGLGINIIATGKYFCFDFKQSFESDKYVKEFTRLLKENGLECRVSERIDFTPPTDVLIKRKA